MKQDLMIFIDYDYDKLKLAFAKSLKEIRAFVGFSLLDLEKLTGINNPSLSRYENGKVEPSISQAIIIADCFQLSIEDFVLYGLGLKPDNCDSETIIDRFKETIADMIFDMGKNAENILKKLYAKVNIDDIIEEYL